MDMPYRQVSLAVVRDPVHHQKTKLIATITVHHNKRIEHVARSAQDET